MKSQSPKTALKMRHDPQKARNRGAKSSRGAPRARAAAANGVVRSGSRGSASRLGALAGPRRRCPGGGKSPGSSPEPSAQPSALCAALGAALSPQGSPRNSPEPSAQLSAPGAALGEWRGASSKRPLSAGAPLAGLKGTVKVVSHEATPEKLKGKGCVQSVGLLMMLSEIVVVVYDSVSVMRCPDQGEPTDRLSPPLG